MTRANVQIHLRSPRGATITVDGQEISRGVTALTVTADPDNAPLVQLDVLAVPVDIVGDDVAVQLLTRPETYDALIALGWAPPEEPTPPRSRYVLVNWRGFEGDPDETLISALQALTATCNGMLRVSRSDAAAAATLLRRRVTHDPAGPGRGGNPDETAGEPR